MPSAIASPSTASAAAKPKACPVCRSADTSLFFTLRDVPCQDGIIWPTREAARQAARGDIELVYCPACSHVFNQAFDPSIFTFDASYNISLHHSPAYRQFIDDLIAGLVERHGLRNKTVLEIGCGKADFLKAVCLPYGNRGQGFDPTFTDDCFTADERKTLAVTKDYYSPAKYPAAKGDLVTFRSMLQYMTDPRAFVAGLLPAIAAGGVLYAEVPNSAHVFEQLCIWNIVYEHGCFYSRQSLAKLMSEVGLAVQDSFACWVEDQNLGVEAGLAPADRRFEFDQAEIDAFTHTIEAFTAAHREKTAYWNDTLATLKKQGKTLAMWGAGARAQSFCNLFGVHDDTLPSIVDINPHRQGKFMPKTLQQVVPPGQLLKDNPDVILITNSGYAAEIRQQIAAMNIAAEIMVI